MSYCSELDKSYFHWLAGWPTPARFETQCSQAQGRHSAQTRGWARRLPRIGEHRHALRQPVGAGPTKDYCAEDRLDGAWQEPLADAHQPESHSLPADSSWYTMQRIGGSMALLRHQLPAVCGRVNRPPQPRGWRMRAHQMFAGEATQTAMRVAERSRVLAGPPLAVVRGAQGQHDQLASDPHTQMPADTASQSLTKEPWTKSSSSSSRCALPTDESRIAWRSASTVALRLWPREGSALVKPSCRPGRSPLPAWNCALAVAAIGSAAPAPWSDAHACDGRRALWSGPSSKRCAVWVQWAEQGQERVREVGEIQGEEEGHRKDGGGPERVEASRAPEGERGEARRRRKGRESKGEPRGIHVIVGMYS
eukprot:scaffold129587_cov33-Tisochrysis_lutea.AAC.1